MMASMRVCNRERRFLRLGNNLGDEGHSGDDPLVGGNLRDAREASKHGHGEPQVRLPLLLLPSLHFPQPCSAHKAKQNR